MVIAAGSAWSFLYLKDMHPLGSLSPRLGKDHIDELSIVFKDAKLVGRSGGKKTWVFDAKTIEVSKDRTMATFKGITRGSMLDGDKVFASISAKDVTYNTYSRNVSIPGTAQLTMATGPTLKIRNILWIGNESKLNCFGGVDATIDGGTVHGDSMVVDFKKKELTIQKVNGQIKL